MNSQTLEGRRCHATIGSGVRLFASTGHTCGTPRPPRRSELPSGRSGAPWRPVSVRGRGPSERAHRRRHILIALGQTRPLPRFKRPYAGERTPSRAKFRGQIPGAVIDLGRVLASSPPPGLSSDPRAWSPWRSTTRCHRRVTPATGARKDDTFMRAAAATTTNLRLPTRERPDSARHHKGSSLASRACVYQPAASTGIHGRQHIPAPTACESAPHHPPVTRGVTYRQSLAPTLHKIAARCRSGVRTHGPIYMHNPLAGGVARCLPC